MLRDGWLLASVTFSASFILSLIVNRNIGIAFSAGAIGVLATFCGVIVVNAKQRLDKRRILTVLELEIREMQEWEIELYHSLSVMAAQQQRTEIQVNSLKRQLNQISAQTVEQQKYKNQIERELIILGEQRRKLEAEVREWETQLYHLEQQREELDLCVRSLAAEKHNTELILQSLRSEIENYESQNDELLYEQTYEDEFPILDILAEEVISPEIPDEWADFVAELTNSELEVLKAIVTDQNPSASIKKIAETYITMPELLIDAINQRALATIGDIIIDSATFPPTITEDDYLTKIEEILKFKY